MVKCDLQATFELVLERLEHGKTEAEVCRVFGVSRRTVEKLVKAYDKRGIDGLRCKSRKPLSLPNKLKPKTIRQIISIKQEQPAWGARRIAAHMFYSHKTKISWRSIHRVLKNHGLLVCIKAKPQPCRRFQWRHVDSLWQMDCFEFRIRGAGKVYVFDVLDDCSRYLVAAKAFLDKRASKARMTLRAAFKRGRMPRALYVNNGTHFNSAKFRRFCRANCVKLIFETPYHLQGRGKIEAFHKILHRELKKFATYCNKRRPHGGVGWLAPAKIYFNERS